MFARQTFWGRGGEESFCVPAEGGGNGGMPGAFRLRRRYPLFQVRVPLLSARAYPPRCGPVGGCAPPCRGGENGIQQEGLIRMFPHEAFFCSGAGNGSQTSWIRYGGCRQQVGTSVGTRISGAAKMSGAAWNRIKDKKRRLFNVLSSKSLLCVFSGVTNGIFFKL